MLKIDARNPKESAKDYVVRQLVVFGAPPGYVGYEEGGELTEKVRRNNWPGPSSVRWERGGLDL